MIAIIILNYNTSEMTLECIESIERNTITEHRYYIVDNASTDDSYTKIKNEFKNKKWNIPKYTLIKSEKNNGYSDGNNIGIRAAIKDGCQYILIINSDVLFENNVIDLMIDILKNNDEIAVIGPNIIDEHGNEQYFVRRPLNFKSFLKNKKPLYYFYNFNINNQEYLKIRNIRMPREKELYIFNGMVSGCCYLFKSDIFQNIGYLDEKVFLNHEEDIIAYKIIKEGYKCAFFKKAMVIHRHSASISKCGKAFERYHRYLSSIYVLKYYAKEPRLFIILASLINAVPFFVNSIFYQEYFDRLLQYLKTNIKIIISNKPIEIR